MNLKKVLFFVFVGLISCQKEEEDAIVSPKPRGFFRIQFPEKKYQTTNTNCAFNFSIPIYANLEKDNKRNAEPCWYNLNFKDFKATLYLSYKPVNNNIEKFIAEAHDFANKHQIKASAVNQIVIDRKQAKVYGLIFEIEGNAASALQFYVTDSTKHFLRGSLYFNCKPNSDSLKPVLNFIKQDILNLIQTTNWK